MALISALSIACKLSELRLLICVEVNAFTWDDDNAFRPSAPIAASWSVPMVLTARVLSAWSCAVLIDCICVVVNLDICAEVIALISAVSMLEILSALMLVSWSVVKARTCVLESAFN